MDYAQVVTKGNNGGSHIVKYSEANLLAIAPSTNSLGARVICSEIGIAVSNITKGIAPVEVMSAVSTMTTASNSLLVAIADATRSLREQKMLDQDSAHSSLLDSLAQTLKESDSTTEAHVQRTRTLAEALGIRLGLTDLELSSLALLCLLHDIGKLGIPLEILNKPGKLSNEEWELMRSHVEKGYRIALASEELEDIAPFILHHHECWDGSGYPDGLKHEAIPLLARIIAVVDTFDAMVNDRPYRDALPIPVACAELINCSGTQFDPYIVSQVIEMLVDDELVTQEEIESALRNEEPAIKPRITDLSDFDIEGSDKLAEIHFTEYVLDTDNRIIKVDENFEALTGYSFEDVCELGMRQSDLLFAEDVEVYGALVKKVLDDRGEAYIEHRIRRKDGLERYVFCYGRPFHNVTSNKFQTSIIAFDVRSTKAMATYIHRERDSARRSIDYWEQGARSDSLTGLLNHDAFRSSVNALLMDKSSDLLLGILDIDYFKSFNDTYGHPAGDELLKTVAQLMCEALPVNAVSGRLGGDEFAVAIPCPIDTDVDELAQIAFPVWQNIMNTLAKGSSKTTVSIGVSVSSKETAGFEELYDLADGALYCCKESGRGRIVVQKDGQERYLSVEEYLQS